MLAFPAQQNSVFQYMNTVDSPDVVNFGAQYLNLRYDLITPIYHPYVIGYSPTYGIGVRLMASLFPIQTHTGKNCQASLGVPMKSLQSNHISNSSIGFPSASGKSIFKSFAYVGAPSTKLALLILTFFLKPGPVARKNG